MVRVQFTEHKILSEAQLIQQFTAFCHLWLQK